MSQFQPNQEKPQISPTEPGSAVKPGGPVQQASSVATSAASFVESTMEQVTQCCEVLAEPEKAGRAFIAFKWFRDEALTKSGYSWTVHAEERQCVLAKAIELSLIQTNRIPNPKKPQFPTTTVSLNRSKANGVISSRFRPVPVTGEPASETLIRMRNER